MIQVWLRIAVWVTVFAVGYLVFGPQLFDSSRSANPFESGSSIFLPPAKSTRQVEYENLINTRGLSPEESEEYQALVLERESNFWRREGVSVEEAISGVRKQRKETLAMILEKRGMSKEEVTIFFMVVERDHPELLTDRD